VRDVCGCGTRAGASPARIRGKWGIGAGVFGSGTETSVIRVRSERSACVLNLSFGGEAVDSRADGTPLPGSYEGEYNSWKATYGQGGLTMIARGSSISTRCDS